ncbi:hypothetical protein Pint_26508 [Pistacia integerrima]|uniref:Uncharacterized protein n=1 Tax=Pistacia integerrima TaxID=434235 RepID=A0ACC0YBK0_9ROSI|nr:hypothetical protein Pint_26508 [Pistacia integerrima]
MEEVIIRQGRSLAETPTYSVASVITVLVFVCYVAQKSIYKFGKWLKKTRRKALFASLEKIKEADVAGAYIFVVGAMGTMDIRDLCEFITFQQGINTHTSHQCGEGREPFVSLEGLEQLHRFLFVLGITHVLYSCLAVGLAMSKIYSWRKWEYQAAPTADASLQGKVDYCGVIMQLCFLRQFKGSIRKSDYLALRLGFITKHKLPLSYNFHNYMVRSMEDEFHGILGIRYAVIQTELHWPLWGYAIVCIFINIHGLNIYFWLSFIPAILVMLVGTKLQHVVSSLALEIKEQTGPPVGTQVKPSDDLFWFRKPVILLRLIQFIIFQNAFEMATFIWSLWGLEERSCFLKNHYMIIIRLTSGVLVQFWCSYSTVPLNVIVTQMGSQWKKALVAESVRESLHSWCKRVKERSKHDSLHSRTTRSICSLESTIDERDEIMVASSTLSRSSSMESLNQVTITSTEQAESVLQTSEHPETELSFRVQEYLSDTININALEPPITDEEGSTGNGEEGKVETLFDLFQKT